MIRMGHLKRSNSLQNRKQVRERSEFLQGELQQTVAVIWERDYGWITRLVFGNSVGLFPGCSHFPSLPLLCSALTRNRSSVYNSPSQDPMLASSWLGSLMGSMAGDLRVEGRKKQDTSPTTPAYSFNAVSVSPWWFLLSLFSAPLSVVTASTGQPFTWVPLTEYVISSWCPPVPSALRVVAVSCNCQSLGGQPLVWFVTIT